MATELKGNGKSILFGKEKLAVVPLIGKVKKYDYLNINKIEYLLSSPGKLGIFKLYCNSTIDIVKFPSSQNDILVNVLVELITLFPHIEIICLDIPSTSDTFHDNMDTYAMSDIQKDDYGTLSIGKISRRYNIGFYFAQNIMNALYNNHYVGEENGYKPRKLLCNENIVWKFIDKNLPSFRPANYDSMNGIGNSGGLQETEILYNNYDSMSGLEFENFCSKLLERNGFTNVEVTQGSGDHGIDILAEKEDITYAIQCKCYSSNIGNAAVQQAHTGKSLYHKDIAVVLTNRYFTQQAIEEATALGVKLWDRDKLDSMAESLK